MKILLFDKYLRETDNRKNNMKTIIDVGAANVSSLNSKDTYYLFEPEKEAYDKLVNRFKKNRQL